MSNPSILNKKFFSEKWLKQGHVFYFDISYFLAVPQLAIQRKHQNTAHMLTFSHKPHKANAIIGYHVTANGCKTRMGSQKYIFISTSSCNRLAWFARKEVKKTFANKVLVFMNWDVGGWGLLLTYPSNFRRPGHYDGVGDSCGQSDQWGNVDGSAGPLWFHAIFGRRQISLVNNNRKTINGK